MKRSGIAGLLAMLCCCSTLAADVVAEAEAQIINDDIILARQIALRRAMATAVEQETSLLQSSTISTPSGVETRTTLTPQRRALSAKILSEHATRSKLQLTAEVMLSEPGRVDACDAKPRRKALVTAFPLLNPEQIKYGQYTGWPRATAEELTRLINTRGRLLAAAMPGRYPFVTAESAPVPETMNDRPLHVGWAQQERAQYVIAGIFRDFGVTTQAMIIPERQMVVDAYIYDGINGELIARREFAHNLNFSYSIPSHLTPGSKNFRESRLGQLYYELLDSMSQWAENSLSCLPFAARVIRTDNRQVYIDVGSDSGIEPGQELVLTQLAPAVSTPAGDNLPGERSAVAGAIVRQVHPRHSIVEISARKNPPAVRVGDVLYGL